MNIREIILLKNYNRRYSSTINDKYLLFSGCTHPLISPVQFYFFEFQAEYTYENESPIFSTKFNGKEYNIFHNKPLLVLDKEYIISQISSSNISRITSVTSVEFEKILSDYNSKSLFLSKTSKVDIERCLLADIEYL